MYVFVFVGVFRFIFVFCELKFLFVFCEVRIWLDDGFFCNWMYFLNKGCFLFFLFLFVVVLFWIFGKEEGGRERGRVVVVWDEDWVVIGKYLMFCIVCEVFLVFLWWSLWRFVGCKEGCGGGDGILVSVLLEFVIFFVVVMVWFFWIFLLFDCLGFIFNFLLKEVLNLNFFIFCFFVLKNLNDLR